ncbi:hypothetical protein CsSME_00044879 [Camellia sinensis var. sinensis]
MTTTFSGFLAILKTKKPRYWATVLTGIKKQPLKSQYQYPNLDAPRTALRYRNRGWAELLNFEPTYRYSGSRKTRVTNFLLEPSPEPDPALLQIRLIPLTEKQDMAKKRAVRALITETTAQLSRTKPRYHKLAKHMRPW